MSVPNPGLYNYHGSLTVLALEWAATDVSLSDHGPSHLGGGENFSSHPAFRQNIYFHG